MSGSIHLHPKKGLNPHLRICPRCGKDSDIVLLGIHDKIYKCKSCGLNIIGGRSFDKCPNPKCHDHEHARGMEFVRDIEEWEKLPGSVCDECRKEIAEHRKVVEAGGVYWKCKDCKREGVIKADAPFSAMVRAQKFYDCPACHAYTVNPENPDRCAKCAGPDNVLRPYPTEPPAIVGVEFEKNGKPPLACPVCGPNPTIVPPGGRHTEEVQPRQPSGIQSLDPNSLVDMK